MTPAKEESTMTPEQVVEFMREMGYERQEDLAEALSLHRTTVSRWINGKEIVTTNVVLMMDGLRYRRLPPSARARVRKPAPLRRGTEQRVTR